VRSVEVEGTAFRVTLSDGRIVVMHLRYTALDGGDKLRTNAAEWVGKYVKCVEDLSQEEGLFAFFDLRHDFPNEWYNTSGIDL
jgi:hypothetical protein